MIEGPSPSLAAFPTASIDLRAIRYAAAIASAALRRVSIARLGATKISWRSFERDISAAWRYWTVWSLISVARRAAERWFVRMANDLITVDTPRSCGISMLRSDKLGWRRGSASRNNWSQSFRLRSVS